MLLTEANECDSEKVLSTGRVDGWIEDFDIVHKNEPITKQSLCRITHLYMKKVLNIVDEDDWQSATKLLDLYDCRTCVIHIAQMYVKGIVKSKSATEFGNNDFISLDEAKEILIRIKEHAVSKTTRQSGLKAQYISFEQAISGDYFLVDVRGSREIQAFPVENAFCCPMGEIIKNPDVLSRYRDKPLVLFCSEGYQSKIAAQCLLDAGYENVYYSKL